MPKIDFQPIQFEPITKNIDFQPINFEPITSDIEAKNQLKQQAVDEVTQLQNELLNRNKPVNEGKSLNEFIKPIQIQNPQITSILSTELQKPPKEEYTQKQQVLSEQDRIIADKQKSIMNYMPSALDKVSENITTTTKDMLNIKQGFKDIASTVKVGGVFGNALLGTFNPLLSLERKKLLWEQVPKVDEQNPEAVDRISNAITTLGLVYGGYQGIKAVPELYNWVKNESTFMKNMITNKKRALDISRPEIVSNEQLLNIYKDLPQEMKAPMVRNNPRLQNLLKTQPGMATTEEAIVPTEIKPQIVQPTEEIVKYRLTPEGKEIPVVRTIEPKPIEPIKQVIPEIKPVEKPVTMPTEQPKVILRDINSIKPTQFGGDLYNNTSRGYARGDIVENQYTSKEKLINVGKLTKPEQLPPIVIDKQGNIIDGNQRWAAAKIARLKEVPVIIEAPKPAEIKAITPEIDENALISYVVGQKPEYQRGVKGYNKIIASRSAEDVYKSDIDLTKQYKDFSINELKEKRNKYIETANKNEWSYPSDVRIINKIIEYKQKTPEKVEVPKEPIKTPEIAKTEAMPKELIEEARKYNTISKFIDSLSTLKSIRHPIGLNLGNVEEINNFLKDRGIIIKGSGTETATIKIPKELVDRLNLPKKELTLKNNYYEVNRPGALYNLHSDKTALARKIQREELIYIYNKAHEQKLPITEIAKPKEPQRLTNEKLIDYGRRLGEIEGKEKAEGIIRSAKEILDRRRSFIKAVQKQFELSDDDLRTITKRDIRLMNNIEFKNFIDDIRIKAEKLSEKLEAKSQLIAQINYKELNIENLRKSMKSPKIDNMTTEQLREFDKVLEPYQKGDVFLTQRTLETINRTELNGIRTYREARERLAKKLSEQESKFISPEDLNKLKISEFDRFKSPVALHEKDPFFRMVTEETAKLRLIRDAEYLELEQRMNKLANKLKTSFIQKLIPQQKNISKWFNATDKSTVELTKEESDVIQEMQKNLLNAKDYLVKMEAMEKGIATDRYYHHIRRSFLESVKEDGIIQATKEVFDKYKLDEQGFNILDTQTGEILANDKFFGATLHRTGQLIPSENIIKSYLTYMKTFKTKQALDEITPLIMTYANALTPKRATKTGLLLHGDLIRFMKEWLNTQKGRRITLIAKQGGKIDWALQGMRTFTTWIDLGLNIPVSVATQVGELAVTNQLLGKGTFIPFMGLANMAKAQAMSVMPKGNRIIEKYRNFIGKNIWSELVEPAKDIGDRLSEGVFALFKDANVRRNKLFLLGSMTRKEWETETISPERLAQLKLESGRYAMIEGAKSIIGATPEAGQFTQYKSWALPILSTTIRNIGNLSTLLTKDKRLGVRSLAEFYRILELIGLVVVVKSFIGEDKKDTSMEAKIKKRAYQESTTLLQAIEPKLFLGIPRVQSFLNDLGKNLSTLYKLEEYKTDKQKGELKGLSLLEKQFTPRAIKQFEQPKKKQGFNTNIKIIK